MSFLGLWNCSDYRGLGEQDQYEEEGLNDSLEDERDLSQILQDRNAAEMELESRDARVSNNRKLPELLHDNGNLSPLATYAIVVHIFCLFFLEAVIFMLIN